MLLSADDSRAGFTAFQFATFPEFAELFQSYVDWQEDAARGPRRSRPQHPHRRDRRVLRRPCARLRRVDRPRAGGGAGARPRRGRPARRHRVGPGLRRRLGDAPRRARRAGRRRRRTASPARTRPRRHWRSSPCDWRRRARRCSSPRARGSPSPSRSTGRDPRVRRQRTDIATVARLQALLAPPERSEPRIAPARRGELRPLARIVAQVAGRVSGTGPPNIFTTLGQHPRLFRAWLRYSAHLMPFGALPRRDTELVILRVAWQCRSAYEWQQHVPLALRVGLTPDEIAGVAGESPAGALHRAPADAAGRQRRAARPARALRLRPGARSGRVSATARRSSCACWSGTTKAWRPRSAPSESRSSRVLSPRRRARATPPRTRASCLRRARRSAPR